MNIMNNMMRIRWLVWHRRLGLITCIGVLLWGLSGLSHPIMTRLQPEPVRFTAPTQQMDLRNGMTPAQVLARQGIPSVLRLSAIALGQETYFRVVTIASNPARYFSTKDGNELLQGDRHYAEYLARYYSGRSLEEVSQSRFITEFSDEYHEVNRLLPVWRVEFKGKRHLRAFIDTDQARLATLSDDTRYLLTRLFRFGHNWSFLEDSPRMQVSLMALVLTIALLSAGSGLYMYFKRREHAAQRLVKQSLRCWHRRLGLLIALSTLLFAGSGSFHLIMSFKQARAETPAPDAISINASQLSDSAWQQATTQPLAMISLITQGNQPLWLEQRVADAIEQPRAQVAVLAQEHHHEPHAKTAVDSPQSSLVSADGDAYAISDVLALAQIQASNYARKSLAEITQTRLIKEFGTEYGFNFKRLPVYKVQFQGEGNPRYYIEPVTGALAAKISDMDAIEGWSFAYLHKWEFASFNKNFRDILVSLFALGNILVALMGLWLFSYPSKT